MKIVQQTQRLKLMEWISSLFIKYQILLIITLFLYVIVTNFAFLS